MADDNLIIEQRGIKRFALEEGVVIWRNAKSNIGSILDINEQGASFIYISDTGLEAERTDRLHIYFLGGKITVNNVTITIVSDFPVSAASFFSRLSKRRRSVKFENLTDKQRQSLDTVAAGLLWEGADLALQESMP
jgi:hypothetical protein